MQARTLRDQLFDELYLLRTEMVLFEELRTRLRDFANLPDHAWIEAFRTLQEAGLAEVGHIPSGVAGAWGPVLNADHEAWSISRGRN